MATKYAAKGAKVSVEITAVFEEIPSVADFELSLGDAEEIDVTTHDSTGGFREFVNGFKNPEEITIPIVYDPADTVHQYLASNHGGDVQNFEVELPDASSQTWEFSGNIKGFTIGAPVDGRMEATVTVKPTGPVSIKP